MQIGIPFNPGTKKKKKRDIKDGRVAGFASEKSGPSVHFRGGISVRANALLEPLI